MSYSRALTPPEERDKWFPKKIALPDLVARGEFLLKRIGESIYYPSEAHDRDKFETVLHDLAHHATLTVDSGDHGIFARKRKVPIAEAIDDMPPFTQDANEVDTIAVQLETSWWLRRPLRLNEPVNMIPEQTSFSYLTVRQVRRMLIDIRNKDYTQTTAIALARTIYNTSISKKEK